MNDNYFNLRTKARKLRDRYKELTIEEKVDLMKLELILEGKSINPNLCHTKAEKKALKRKKAMVRRHNKNNKINNKEC